MDPDQQRIEEDLRGLVQGEVRCDDVFTQLYSTDASIYELRPLGVVRPRSVGDVVAIVRYAAENHLPVHARGAGTGLAGESLGRGLVVDFSRYFRRLITDEGQRVRVQTGMVLDNLNRYLRQSGRLFGPDPAMRTVTTMGSVVAIDAGGSHWPRYGSARHHVEELQVVLADGTVLRLGRHSISHAANGAPPNGENAERVEGLVESVAGLIQRHTRTIEDRRPRSPVNCSGYRLDDVLEGGKLNLARLLVGSEGTLGLITEATLSVDPLPLHRSAVLLLFESLDQAAHAALEIAALKPAACDLMDRRHLSLARETDVRYELLIPGEAEAVLLVECHADSREELRHKLDEIVELVQYQKNLAAASHLAEDDLDFQLYWGLAQRFVPTLHRTTGSSRPTPCVEDIAVPVGALPVFIRHLQDTLKHFQVTASVFGHAAQGQLHIRPFLDLRSEGDIRTMESLAAELYEKVWLLRGTISGEHGDGLSRTPFLAKQYGPLVNVFRELKQIFDPEGIFNPGKIVPIAPTRMTQHIRASGVHLAQPAANGTTTLPSENGQPPKLFELELSWTPDEIESGARACNGCGICRTTSPDTRMCPIFRMNPREEASPRAKANIIRGLISGNLPTDTLLQDVCKEVADLCVHCHMCRLECPVNVDAPKLMLEAKAAYVNTNGLTLHDRILTRIDTLASFAGRLPGIANWAIGHPQMRWLLEKLIGIAQGRKLPRLARRSFLQQAAMRRLHHVPRTSADKVVYFVDTYANHFDTQLGEALVAVLRHNGVAVFVRQDQVQAGMPMIAAGALDPAREVAARNVAALAESVRQGYTIVATEPSAALALTHEYPILLDNDEDALAVAQNTQEACHYLWQMHLRGRLNLRFQPQRISVGYHVPCHLRALGVGAPAENLLRLVPGIKLNRLEKGCSGMAGLWGVKRDNYRASLRAGRELISTVRDGPFQIGVTECSTCKMQMEQGSEKPTIHPLKLLALAYGLMPEIADLVRSTGKPLVVS
jgi:FAD/FMN-containing dehydrogenase/Fe-S oxidoreductase